MTPAALLLSSSLASHTCAAGILFGKLQHPDSFRDIVTQMSILEEQTSFHFQMLED
jgi:hypothetical protein